MCSRSVSAVRKEVDVAVIGNGPSGIFLSLLLSGHWPYFSSNGGSHEHPNHILTARLAEQPDVPLIKQDLDYLSEGLEGRSGNPVSLLLDTLLLPNTDIGEEHPSALEWRHQEAGSISHIVFGSGSPGGSWHEMEKSARSLSSVNWLELPVYSFQEWLQEYKVAKSDPDHICFDSVVSGGVYSSSGSQATDTGSGAIGDGGRVDLRSMAAYYADYVEKMNLGKNFLNRVTVTQVQEINRRHPCNSFSTDSDVSSNEDEEESEEEMECKFYSLVDDSSSLDHSEVDDCQSKGYMWRIQGTRRGKEGQREEVSVCAKKLVLACGVGGSPRMLGVPGENLGFVKHSFSSRHMEGVKGPVMVVGAGLSAADAVLLALSKGLEVFHVYHQSTDDPSLMFHKMPPQLYKEYCHVFGLMKGTVRNPLYHSLPLHNVLKFEQGGECIVQSGSGDDETQKNISCALALVLVGSVANLDFLPRHIASKLGFEDDQPISSKRNPVNIDMFSFECENVPSLYAMGPLVGDNFVRFAIGGGLGITHSLLDEL